MKYINETKECYAACSVIGQNNKERAAECEDVIYIDKASGINFFGLADGQTGKEHCCDGGKEVLSSVFRFIIKKGISQMINYEHTDELQYELIRTIRETISKLASSAGMEKAEYASTVVAFAYDPKTYNFVLIHLGDGGIIGQGKNEEISMLSSPENGLTANYTWLTTSQDALNHLRIEFGNTRFYKRILMITDGASVFANGKNIPDKSKRLIASGSREDIVSFLNESNPEDDASCIVIDFV